MGVMGKKKSPMELVEYEIALKIVRKKKSVLGYTIRFGLGHYEIVAFVDAKKKDIIKRLRKLHAVVYPCDTKGEPTRATFANPG